MAGASLVRNLLAHPLTRGLDIDDPATTALRRQLLCEKPFLREIYRDWYSALTAALPGGDGHVLELGSGAGFLRDYFSEVITSEVFHCPWVSIILDGRALPFVPGQLRGIVMTNVLHHIPDPTQFLREAAHVIRPGGVVAMIEPWFTRWSGVVYRRLHHEPFFPESEAASFDGAGPLSAANGALPWILFERDRAALATRCPEWQVETVRPMMPFRYLLSGGVSMRSLMPGWSSAGWRAVERAFQPWMGQWGMFALIVMRRSADAGPDGE